MSELAVTKANDRDEWDFNAPIGRRNTGQHPRHFHRVCEREDHLVHELVFTDCTGDRSESRIRWHDGYEFARIEVAQGRFAIASRQDRDMVDVSVVDHGSQRGLRVTGDEFIRGMLFPEFDEVVLWHGGQNYTCS